MILSDSSFTLSVAITILDNLFESVFQKVFPSKMDFLLSKLTHNFTESITSKIIDNFVKSQNMYPDCVIDSIPNRPGLDFLVPIKTKIQPIIKTLKPTSRIKLLKIDESIKSNQKRSKLHLKDLPMLIKLQTDLEEDSQIQEMRRRKVRREGNANQTLQDIYTLINLKKQAKHKTQFFQFTSDYNGKKLYFNRNLPNSNSPIFARVIVKERIIENQDQKNKSRDNLSKFNFSNINSKHHLHNIACRQNKLTNISDILKTLQLNKGVEIDYQKSYESHLNTFNNSSKFFHHKENPRYCEQDKLSCVQQYNIPSRKIKLQKQKQKITKHNHKYIEQFFLNRSKPTLQHYFTESTDIPTKQILYVKQQTNFKNFE